MIGHVAVIAARAFTLTMPTADIALGLKRPKPKERIMSEKQFSRRNLTSAPFLASQEAKEIKIQKWYATITDNEAARADRSDKEQLTLISTRRGESKKEKARLLSRIERVEERAKAAGAGKSKKKTKAK